MDGGVPPTLASSFCAGWQELPFFLPSEVAAGNCKMAGTLCSAAGLERALKPSIVAGSRSSFVLTSKAELSRSRDSGLTQRPHSDALLSGSLCACHRTTRGRQLPAAPKYCSEQALGSITFCGWHLCHCPFAATQAWVCRHLKRDFFDTILF